MSVVTWVVVLDSESVLVSTNVLVPEEGSLGVHSSLDLELDTISQWVSSEVEWSSVNEPGLVGAVVAFPPDDLVVVSVSSTLDVEAHTGQGSEVSSASWVV